MGVVIRKDSPYFWLTIERPGLPPLRESTKILARGLPPPVFRENRALAEQVYATRLGDLARSRHGISTERPRLTFRAWAAWYREHVTPTKRTAARERSALRSLEQFFSRYYIDRIDGALVKEFLTARRKSVQPQTCNRELDVLKSMLSSAVPKYLAANPLFGVRRLRARAPETHMLTFEQEAALLARLEPRDRALLICALDALLRLGDVVKLRWSQDRGAYFDVWDPKGEPYRPPVSSRLRAALEGFERKGARVFWWHADENAVIRWFAAACADAGIPHGRPDGVTFHSLRHTGATRFMRVPGATLRDLMAVGGWRDLKSVMRYQHVSGAARAVVDRMSEPPPCT
ncbi:MAG: tyrosine-type recombinase/integrase [Acidobacteria bacterium]|nr:tyrosine-type recombinase/integrase [Acidobacteriota bacterium]